MMKIKTCKNQLKRGLYKDGETAAKTARITGVNKMIMLCTFPEVAETYENII